MRFCKHHWTMLRKAIDDRGLTALVAKDGATATANMARELAGTDDASTFDPLMMAHWAISGNSMRLLEKSGGPQAALSLMAAEVCPVCEVNRAHELTCSDPKCKLDKKHGYDWMIDRAADDALARARELKRAPAAS